jgi:hypothetical protein
MGTSKRWITKISAAWQKSLDAIFQVGDLLLAAKKDIPHGEFEQMTEADLPFGSRTAECLMTVARDKRLRKPNHGSLLPPSWRTLYDLSRLPDTEFKRAIADGKIHSDMTRAEVEKLQPSTQIVAPPITVPFIAQRPAEPAGPQIVRTHITAGAPQSDGKIRSAEDAAKLDEHDGANADAQHSADERKAVYAAAEPDVAHILDALADASTNNLSLPTVADMAGVIRGRVQPGWLRNFAEALLSLADDLENDSAPAAVNPVHALAGTGR